MAVDPRRLEDVAGIVSQEPYVNHNYERDHAINLWFVVTAPDQDALSASLHRVEAKTELAVLDLRLITPYHIDLGFRLDRHEKNRLSVQARRPASAQEQRLLAAIENGIPLMARPYATIAEILGSSEKEVIAALERMIEAGIVSRFGCVLRHRDIGFTANAMAVWDVDDGCVDRIGRLLAQEAGITLCYRRRRALPRWPYNLYVMVHGSQEEEVRARIACAARSAGIADARHAILFSRRCFVQRGARFSKVCP
jgi:DNA-binding Lrp family transcriptional regulator